MKRIKILVVLGLVVSMIMGLGACKNTQPQARFTSLSYLGCNQKQNLPENYQDIVQNDTVIYYYINDTLYINVGMNYMCCATFDATQTIEDNKIVLKINETTPSTDLYCRCMCYYVFKYSYTELTHNSYEVKVVFSSLDDSKDKIFINNINIERS